MPTPTARHRLAWLVAPLLMATLPAWAQGDAPAPPDADEPQAPAEGEGERPDPPEVEIDLTYYVFIPATPNVGGDSSGVTPNDPTIIPFSNWQFRGADGEWQPWRKRGEPFQDRPGGQRAREERLMYAIEFAWAASGETPIGSIRFKPEGNSFGAMSETWAQGDNRDDGSWTKLCRQRRFFGERMRLPNQARFRSAYEGTEWETVATADFDSQFPVGDNNYRIESLQRLDGDYTLRVDYKEDYNRDLWRYRLEYVGGEGPLSVSRTSAGSRGNERHRRANPDLEDFLHIEIQRTPVFEVRLDPIDLGLLDDLEHDELTQRRIELTPAHRFGEPRRVRLDPQGPGSNAVGGVKCLLDLDTLRIVAYPEGQPDGEALAMFLEDEEVDLNLVGPSARMVASPIYPLDAEHWDSTPSACVAAIREDDERARYRFRVDTQAGSAPHLTTTSDGTMVLFRVTEVAPDDAEHPGQVTLEVRRLMEP